MLLSCFGSQYIWYELVLKGASQSPNVPAWLEKTVSSGLAFKINLKTLMGFSLIETKQIEGSYAMHSVVQDWCRYIANTDKIVDLIQLNELTLISVGYMVPSGNDRCYAELQSRLIPYADFIFHINWSGDNIAVSRGLHNIGCLYYDQDKLKEAEETFQQALIGKRKALGPDNISTLDTVKNLGVLYSDQSVFLNM